MGQGSITERVKAALSEAFRQHSDASLDPKGYVTDLHDTLLPGVLEEDFVADLSSGNGNELKTKFRAIHSSSGLAVNCFAPFRRRITDLELPGHTEFNDLRFERKCPNGLRRGAPPNLDMTPPNLDMVLAGPGGVVGIESKLTEHLSAHRAKFSPAYEEQIRDARRNQGYFREMQRLEMQRLQGHPKHYTRLDAAQLIKHAFGLAYTFPHRPVTLLYLFWEPANPDAHRNFAVHRAEIKEFEERVAGSPPAFEAMSYPELWQSWRDNASTPGWLHAHLENLRGRYLVSI